jgi:hypothetical protein
VGETSNGKVGMVDRLWGELKGLRKGPGLREPGRLSDCCPTLTKLAAEIRQRQPEDDADQLLDAMDVLMEAAQRLPQDQADIFNMTFALWEDGELEGVGDRRATYAKRTRKSIRTIQNQEDRILKTIAVAIAERARQSRKSESKSGSQPVVAGDLEAEISVEAIQISLDLDDEAVPVRRELTFTITASRDLEHFWVAEAGGERVEIGDTVGCQLFSDWATESMTSGRFREGASATFQELGYAEEFEQQVRETPEAVRKVMGQADTLETLLQALEVVVDSLPLDWQIIKIVPSRLQAGQSHTFSYGAFYREQMARDMAPTQLATPSEANICAFRRSSTVEPEGTYFTLMAQRPLPQVTMRLKSARPLHVLPATRESLRYMSSPTIPLGIANYIPSTPDGTYKHTFRMLAQDEVVSLSWTRKLPDRTPRRSK